MYPSSDGGRTTLAYPGWGCPCCLRNTAPIEGYDGWPQLGDKPIAPGERRRLGFVFLSGDEAAQILKPAGKLYLWEGRFVGEAVIVEDAHG